MDIQMNCFVKGCTQTTKACVDNKNFCDRHLNAAIREERKLRIGQISAVTDFELVLRKLDE